MINIRKETLPRTQNVTEAPGATQDSPALRISEQNPANPTVQRYLTFLRLREVEQTRILEQVMSRASVSGDPGRWRGNVIRELERALAGRTQTERTAQAAAVPCYGTGTVPHNTEDATVWSSSDWRAAAWTTSARAGRLPRILAPTGQPHFTSTPPIKRRPMAPKAIEYISLRGLRRSLLAWLLGKAPAPVSFGRIPGK
jgi:hypothetical protein